MRTIIAIVHVIIFLCLVSYIYISALFAVLLQTPSMLSLRPGPEFDDPRDEEGNHGRLPPIIHESQYV